MVSMEMYTDVIVSLRQAKLNYENERRTYLNSVREDFERNGVNVDDDDEQSTTHRSAIETPPIKPQLKSPKYPEDAQNQENEDPEPKTEAVPKKPKSRPLRGKAAKKNIVKTGNEHCVFCFNNGERHKVFSSHSVRDCNNNVVCPRLLAYTCPTCKQTGVHTMKYCPKKKIVTPEQIYMPVRRGSIRF